MTLPTNSTRRRLIIILFVVSLCVFLLVIRLGYLQIVKGEELKKEALEQWTKGIEVKAKRGVIYDRNGKKLAISVSSYTVWCSPADIKNPTDTAKKVSEILNMDEKEIYQKITKKQRVIKIKQWINKEEADELRKVNLKGIEIVDDNKRYYPYGTFASHILGFTNIDNNGLYGIEKTYDKYLTGTPGKWIKTTDAVGRQLPYGSEKLYEAEDGLSAVMTLDETIQHFAEKAALESLIKNKAKNVSILIMDPNTGDLLAMASKPDYDPNNPREPLDDKMKAEWENLNQDEVQKKWYDMWRNFPINDAYEPGSTFKIITSAAALEENVVTPDTKFYCDGYITDIPGAKLKCWRWYNPHGSETFTEGAQNSCNEVFVEVGRRLGNERMYKYIKGFGFGELTGIELTGEQAGIIPSSPDVMKEVNLATISYGQGIAVTPIQLVTAISAVANGGKLMKPRIVKQLIDKDGNEVKNIKPEVRRQVISKETSETLLEILESVVSKGTGKQAYVPGYRVGGKTGTAQKVIDGRYVQGKYISSFAAIAPVNDPKIVVLVVIDEPSNGVYYGGRIAGPVAGELVKETLEYMDIEPQFTEEEEEEYNKKISVPDVRNKNIVDASKQLSNLGFKYNTETPEVTNKSKVIDQFPLPGTKVNKGSIIDLYLKQKREENSKLVTPNLTGKTTEDVVKFLDNMNLKYKFKGNGIAVNQSPKPGVEIDINTLIKVEFSKIKE